MQPEITETIETLEGDVRTVVKGIRRESLEQEFERRLGELMQKPKDAWTGKDEREAEFLIRELGFEVSMRELGKMVSVVIQQALDWFASLPAPARTCLTRSGINELPKGKRHRPSRHRV